MSHLILIRHGQSQWNLENRFTGWSDVPLTERGRQDAATVAPFLKEIPFDIAWTSRLERGKETLEIILQHLPLSLPIHEDSALNERHYGDLQGLNKAETAKKYGQEQVSLWRRSYSTRPPSGESMEDCERRTTPFFIQYILPQIHAGKNVLVVAHGNSLRPMIKLLGKLSPEEASTMEIGLCTPYIYKFDGKELVNREVREIPGIVTLGASQTQSTIASGRV